MAKNEKYDIPELKDDEKLTKLELFTLFSMQSLTARNDVTASAIPGRAIQIASDTLRELEARK